MADTNEKMERIWAKFEEALNNNGLSFESIKGGVKNEERFEEYLKSFGITNIQEIVPITAEFRRRGGFGGVLGSSSLLPFHIPSVKSFVWGPCIDPNLNYCVPFDQLSLNKLWTRVIEGGCTLVQGPFRSGKTSHLKALKRVLPSDSLIPLEITLLPERNIWEQFYDALPEQLQKQIAPGLNIQYSNIFELFSKGWRTTFPNHRAVVLFDEFQLLIESNERGNFLTSLKLLLDQRDTVQAILGFGTFTLVKLTEVAKDFAPKFKETYSPFSFDQTVYIPRFTTQQIFHLFQTAQQDRKLKLGPGVASDIANQTRGYAGLVGLIGVYLVNIPDYDLFPSGEITMDAYELQLNAALGSLKTSNLFRRLLGNINQSHKYDFILYQIVDSPGPYTIPLEHFANALILADYGLLIYTPQQNDLFMFDLSSSMMRQLILEAWYPSSPISVAPPLQTSLLQDLRSLAQHLVQNINYNNIWVSENRKQIGGGDGTPSEYAFQAEVYAILRQTFQTYYFIIVEAKMETNKRKRADILIRNGMRIVIELKSGLNFGNQKAVKSAVDQIVEYAQAHSCTRGLLLNFSRQVGDNFETCEKGVAIIGINAFISSSHSITMK